MITESGEIICHTTPWYTRRRLLMAGMLLFFSAYFAYDWKIGYPKERLRYLEYWAEYQKLAVEGKDQKAYHDLAKEKGWPESPKEETLEKHQYRLKEQLIWSIGTGLGGLAMMGVWLKNKGTVLKADHESLTTPDGVRIPFASVVKVDKRKWDIKALAYVWWRSGGQTKKAVIDDLMYGNAGLVFDRLMANFQGELVDIERPAPAPAVEEPAPEEPRAPGIPAAVPAEESRTPAAGGS
ncbi:MAG: hypothetical protein EOP86_10535 [Verrucomicrobiaceae bacterium]|nr:MAG: hypothetical protein EOP86_10535 [Verrucomicrobiaceae bacterium]